MRVCVSSAVGVACALALASPALRAAPPPAPAPSTSAAPSSAASAPPAENPEATAEARRHFKLGIKLYQDTNYPGALVEFEAAYAAKPVPGRRE